MNMITEDITCIVLTSYIYSLRVNSDSDYCTE